MDLWQLFIRHAHRDVSDRHLDNGLSERGREQGETLIEYLSSIKPSKKPIKVISSPKIRCLETAKFVSDWAGCLLDIDDRLDEQDSGRESESQFISRLEDFFLEHQFRSKLCFVSHGDVLPILARIAGHPIDEIKKGDLFWIENKGLHGLNGVAKYRNT